MKHGFAHLSCCRFFFFLLRFLFSQLFFCIVAGVGFVWYKLQCCLGVEFTKDEEKHIGALWFVVTDDQSYVCSHARLFFRSHAVLCVCVACVCGTRIFFSTSTSIVKNKYQKNSVCVFVLISDLYTQYLHNSVWKTVTFTWSHVDSLRFVCKWSWGSLFDVFLCLCCLFLIEKCLAYWNFVCFDWIVWWVIYYNIIQWKRKSAVFHSKFSCRFHAIDKLYWVN